MFRRGQNLIERLLLLGIGQRAMNEVGISADDGEQVIEIMSDTPGELADGFHLLRLTELFLQTPLLG